MAKIVSRGDPLEPVYLNNLRVAARVWGVISGLAVSQRGAGANMSVDVALGSARINNTLVSKGSTTNIAITAAHATYDRYDLVVVNSSGVISIVDGVAAATSYANDYDFETNTAILLAEIYVPAADTAIENAQITDKRIFTNEWYVTNGDSHDHNGGDGAQIDHVNLANKGTNTHAQIDAHIATPAAHSNVNLLAALTPSITGWSTQPSTNAQITDENPNQAFTTNGVCYNGSTPVDGYVTYDLGSSKRVVISVILVYSGTLAANTLEVSTDNVNWYAFDTGAAALCRYIRKRVANVWNVTLTVTKLKMAAYQLP